MSNEARHQTKIHQFNSDGYGAKHELFGFFTGEILIKLLKFSMQNTSLARL